MSNDSHLKLAFMPLPPVPQEPRKRPRQARSMATVVAIVEATARIVETLGLNALTTNRVAETAGISIGSLYQYFPTKEALLAEVIRRERDTLLHDIQQAAATAADLQSIVDAFLHAALTHQFRRPRLALALELAEVSLPMAAEDQDLRERICTHLASLLDRHGVGNAEVAAADTIALCRGMIDAAAIRGETDGTAVFPRLRRAVMGYLAADCSGR